MEIIANFFKNIFRTLSSFAFHNLFPALLIFAAGFFSVIIIMKILTKLFDKSKLEKPASTFILTVIRTALFLVLFLVAASSLGIDVTGIIALASVLTLAISLSVQDALTNLIGGFTLLYTKPFRIGDYVEIAGQGGTVEKIGLTYTQLLTADRKTVSMPNRSVVSANIINFTVEGTRRVDISVNVAYGNDPQNVIAALIQAADTPTALENTTPYAALSCYGESTVGYVLQVWCKAEDYWTTLHTVNRNIRTVFTESGVIMTYPHINVHLDK